MNSKDDFDEDLEYNSLVSDNSDEDDDNDVNDDKKIKTTKSLGILPNDSENSDDGDSDIEDELETENDLYEKNKNINDKKKLSEKNIATNISMENEDLEYNDSEEFLQKFDNQQKINYITNNHQECLNKNYDEIKKLSLVTRNSDNIIIDKMHKTTPILTKYEKTRILGIRVKQLNNNNKPYIKVEESILDNYLIAKKELLEKKLPFIIERPLSNNTFEYWNLRDLEII